MNGDLLTVWGEGVTQGNTPDEYPRPQFIRDSYYCLNGYWDCVMAKDCERPTEGEYVGSILVPFSPESVLSGVNRQLAPDEIMRYSRRFELPDGFNKGRVILHFGAVDSTARVVLNDKLLGSSYDGYLPFLFDITDCLRKGGNELNVLVFDPSDTMSQPRGKQKLKRGGIWYTAQSGIWQTVWIESVPESYIRGVKVTTVAMSGFGFEADCDREIGVSVYDGEAKVGEGITVDGKCDILLDNPKLWSPEDPFLYKIVYSCGSDRVSSYAAIRSFSTVRDGNGIARFALNGNPYFLNGVLDQGYWSDGMYTPPSDEAIVYDIEIAKQTGFNMIRKHIKIEPLRWYYHCDRLGIIVWQDMVNGGGKYNMSLVQAAGFVGMNVSDGNYKLFARSDKAGRDLYYAHLERAVAHLYNCPCIAVWGPFNEGWGQFDALKADTVLRDLDSSRLIDHASGWFDMGGGDFKSLHIYYKKVKLKSDRRIIALTEYGGYALKCVGHVFDEKKTFGYKVFKTTDDLRQAVAELIQRDVRDNIERGLSVAVYTQLSDVEDEINGIMTYDRKVVKFPPNSFSIE